MVYTNSETALAALLLLFCHFFIVIQPQSSPHSVDTLLSDVGAMNFACGNLRVRVCCRLARWPVSIHSRLANIPFAINGQSPGYPAPPGFLDRDHAQPWPIPAPGQGSGAVAHTATPDCLLPLPWILPGAMPPHNSQSPAPDGFHP